MARLWDGGWTQIEILARVGRLDQLASFELFEASDRSERGARVLRFNTGGGFQFEVRVDRGPRAERMALAGQTSFNEVLNEGESFWSSECVVSALGSRD